MNQQAAALVTKPSRASLTHKPSRAYCTACLRPQRACICGCVRRASSAVELLILQHPNEERHAKGTARLLHLCLQHGLNHAAAMSKRSMSRLQVGEVFEPAALAQWLTAGGRQAVLLYPSSPPNVASDLASDAALTLLNPALETKPSLSKGVRLVVLDATWQNSRRLLRLNPALHALPRLSLVDPAPTRYRAIRIAHAPHQLSTLEAAAAALAQMDAGFSPLPLLAAFDAFIALQSAFLPAVRKHHRLQAAWAQALAASPCLDRL